MLVSKFFNHALFGQRLLELMEAHDDTTYSLAEQLGLSSGTISRYTSGLMKPKIPTIHAIAEKYGVNPLWIMGVDGAEKNDAVVAKCKKIPIVGIIAAGIPILAEEHIEGYEFVASTLRVDFALRVKGDSMINARIYDGDLVYIRRQPEVENGEIAAVLVGEEEATLKRVYKSKGMVMLRPENLNYEERIFTGKEIEDLSIIGKAIILKSEIR